MFIQVRSRSSLEPKKAQKTLTFGAAHTYIAYIRESPRVLIPFMIIETELAGLRMGVENST